MKQQSGDSLSLSGAIIEGQMVFAPVLTILRIRKDTKLLGKGKQREIRISRRAIPRSLRTSSKGEKTLTILQVYKEIRDALLLLPYLYRTIISLPDLSPLSPISHGLAISIPLHQLPRNTILLSPVTKALPPPLMPRTYYNAIKFSIYYDALEWHLYNNCHTYRPLHFDYILPICCDWYQSAIRDSAVRLLRNQLIGNHKY